MPLAVEIMKPVIRRFPAFEQIRVQLKDSFKKQQFARQSNRFFSGEARPTLPQKASPRRKSF
jgi:hypothetical protein